MAQGHPDPHHTPCSCRITVPPAHSSSCLCFAPCLLVFPSSPLPRQLRRGCCTSGTSALGFDQGYCQCPPGSTQTRSRPPFLLRQEAAGGDVKPQYESLQLGLFCCLPRLISFNYLSPFCFLFFFSPSQILGFFHVIIFFLSPQLRLALPVCLQLPSLFPVLPSLPFCSPPDHPFTPLSRQQPQAPCLPARSHIPPVPGSPCAAFAAIEGA